MTEEDKKEITLEIFIAQLIGGRAKDIEVE